MPRPNSGPHDGSTASGAPGSGAVNLSASLYGFFWLAVFQIVLGVLLALGGPTSPAVAFGHAGIGGAVLVWAFVNRQAMRATRAPARTKRTIAATFALAGVMVVLGGVLLSGVANGVQPAGVPLAEVVATVRLVFALAIVTHAASTATGYDMWEEREFERESEPGTLGFDPAPAPGAAAHGEATETVSR